MPAYLIATIAIHDPETYKKYTAHTPGLVARHGGKFLTRGAPVTALEGPAFTDRMVILEFPTKSDVEAFFNDPAYQEAAVFRRAASVGRLVVQEGAPNTTAPDANL